MKTFGVFENMEQNTGLLNYGPFMCCFAIFVFPFAYLSQQFCVLMSCFKRFLSFGFCSAPNGSRSKALLAATERFRRHQGALGPVDPSPIQPWDR